MRNDFLKIATTTNWQNWVSQLLLLQLPEAAASLWQRNFWQADPATRWGHRRAPGGCSCWSPGWECWVPHESSPVVGFAADWSRLFPPSPHTWGNTTVRCDTCLCLWVGQVGHCVGWLTASCGTLGCGCGTIATIAPMWWINEVPGWVAKAMHENVMIIEQPPAGAPAGLTSSM